MNNNLYFTRTNSCKTQVSGAAATLLYNDLKNSCKTQCDGWSGTLPKGARGFVIALLIPSLEGSANERRTQRRRAGDGVTVPLFANEQDREGVGDTYPSSGTECHLLPHRGEGIDLLIPSLEGRGSKGVGENKPSPQPIGEGAKPTYSLINLFSYSPGKRYAFTLAEVLITLGIIGIVAAMTMPSLIANHRDKKTVAQLKKAYSTLQQAYLMSISKHGAPENWGMSKTITTTNDDGTTQTDYSTVEIFWQYMAENMNTINTGDNLQQYDRYSLDGIKRATTQIKDIPHLILTDGTILVSGYYGNTRMDLFVLLNNCVQKGKCTLGKDMFYFNLYLTPAKILPLGANETQYPKEKFKDYCNKSKNNSDSGKACTAWVLYNENMDYLYCNDLDWNTKTRCH